MASTSVRALSELAEKATTRREFLIKTSVLGALGPLALASCGGDRAEPETQTPQTATAVPQGGPATAVGNPDSKLDTGGNANIHQSTAGVAGSVQNLVFHRFDPTLPPVARERATKLRFTARETPLKIADDAIISAWTFDGDIPGPIVHVRQGDIVEFTLVNNGSIPHSMDFHAAQIDPKEFVRVESEYYLGAAKGGVLAFDYTKMLGTLPDYVVFNGRPSQYMAEPLRVRVGDRVRFYVVNAGPTHPCNFHVVGEQFDTVYLGAPPGMPLRGLQTFAVAPGGGLIFEMLADIPGEFVFVNHGFGHGQKGAIGILKVEG